MKKMMLFYILALVFVIYLFAQTTGPNAGPNRWNSGIITLPASSTSLTTFTTNVNNIHCANTSGAPVTLTITDTAGNTYFPTVSMLANSVMVAYYGETGLTMLGIKWSSGDGTSINCEVTGRQ